MSEKNVYFYNSKNGDRVYDADNMIDWLKPFFTTGVFNNCFRVVANDNMTVSVEGGYANIKGRVINQLDVETVEIAMASGTQSRIDNVVLRRDDVERDIYLLIQQGGYSPNPIAPEITRNDNIYDLKLAEIRVGAGVIAVTQADITDTRMDSAVCGWVMSTVKEIDFSQVTAQFASFFERYEQLINEQYDAYIQALQEYEDAYTNDFTSWFETIKGILDEEAAGHLLNLIQDLESTVSAALTPGGIIGILDSRTEQEKLHADSATNAKRYATLTIGLANTGYTSVDVDTLIQDGEDAGTVITAAINSLPDAGGEVVLLEGDYPIATTVQHDKVGIAVRGMGEATRLFRDGEIDGMLNISESATNARYTNIYFDGMHTTHDVESSYANILVQAAGCYMDNVSSHNSKSYGISINKSASDFRFDGGGLDGCYCGLYIDGASFSSCEMKIQNTVVSNCSNDIKMLNISVGQAIISNVHFSNSQAPIQADICKCTIENCVFFHTGNGLSLNSCTASTIIGNKFESSGSATALVITGTNDGIMVANNNFYSTSANPQAAINIDSTTTYNYNLIGNTILGAFRDAINTRSQRGVISSNMISGAATGINITSEAAFCTVHGNHCLSCTSYGLIVGSNYSTVCGNYASGTTIGLSVPGSANIITGNMVSSIGVTGNYNEEANNKVGVYV